jgi:hypothetical protein
MSPPFQGRRTSQIELCLLPASWWFLAWLILQPWRRKWHLPPKRRLTFNGLHGVISQPPLWEPQILHSQNIVLKHTHSMTSYCEEPSFIPIQNKNWSYSSAYLSLLVFRRRRGIKDSDLNSSKHSPNLIRYQPVGFEVLTAVVMKSTIFCDILAVVPVASVFGLEVGFWKYYVSLFSHFCLKYFSVQKMCTEFRCDLWLARKINFFLL